MFYVKKTIEDADDFVKYVREDEGMQDQIKQWADEDLEELYWYFQDLADCDCNIFDELELWDILRFDFCVYKAKDSNTFLDLNDFISDYKTELMEENENFDMMKFLNDKTYRIDCLINFDLYTMVSASGNIICRYE